MPQPTAPRRAPHFSKSHFNIILPSTPGSSKWSVHLKFPHYKPVSSILCPSQLIPLYSIIRIIFGEECWSWKSICCIYMLINAVWNSFVLQLCLCCDVYKALFKIEHKIPTDTQSPSHNKMFFVRAWSFCFPPFQTDKRLRTKPQFFAICDCRTPTYDSMADRLSEKHEATRFFEKSGHSSPKTRNNILRNSVQIKIKPCANKTVSI